MCSWICTDVFLMYGQHKPAWLARLLLMAGDVEPNPGPRIPTNREISIDRWKRKKADDKMTDSQRKKAARAKRTSSEAGAQRQSNAANMRQSRASRTTPDAKKQRCDNRANMKQARAKRTPSKVDANRRTDAETRKRSRANMELSEAGAQRSANAASKKRSRIERPPSELAVERVDNTERMRSTRKSTREASRRDQSADSIRRSLTAAVASNEMDEGGNDVDDWLESGIHQAMLDDPDFHNDPGNTFHLSQWSLQFQLCNNCSERFPDIQTDGRGYCRRCATLARKDKGKKFTVDNHMDPGPVPSELEGLTTVEQILIAKIVPMMSVFRLPMGQYGYHGNVINIPQNVEEIVEKLPRSSTDTHIMVLRKTGLQGSFHDFRVRRDKIRAALVWLKSKNIYYKHIEISEEQLHDLPQDGHIEMPTVDAESSEQRQIPTSGDNHEGNRATGQVGANQRDETAEIAAMQHCPEPQTTIDSQPFYGFTPSQVPNSPCGFDDSEAFDGFSASEVYQSAENPFNEIVSNDGSVHSESDSESDFNFPIIDDTDLTNNQDETLVVMDSTFVPIIEAQLTENQRKEQEASALLNTNNPVPWPSLAQHSPVDEFNTAGRKEVIQMIEQKGKLPTIFCTLSAADLQWPDLHRLLPGYRSKSQAINENPLLCDWFFVQRVKQILKFFADELNMGDFWGRFEFQHRGSVHFHFLGWLEGAPDVTNLHQKSEEFKARVIKYFDSLVTTVNPAFDNNGHGELPPIPKNPASTSYFNVDDKEMDYLGMLLYCHRHKCRRGYCLKKVNGKLKCRFKFPFDLVEESKLVATTNERSGETTTELVTKRNDSRINSHNARIAVINRSNTDMQPIINKNHVVRYCTKYVTKSEPQSDMLDLMSKAALSRSSMDNPVKVVAQKALIKAVGDRDYSAQETMHTLSTSPYYLCSRTFAHLSLTGNREIINTDGEKTIVSNQVDKYCQRPAEYENLSLMDFTRHHYFVGSTVKTRDNPAIVIAHQLRPVDRESPLYQDYCKHYLMLHKPFRQLNDLLLAHSTYSDAFDEFRSQSPHIGFDIEAEIDNQEQEENEQGEAVPMEPRRDDRVMEDFARLLQLNPDFTNEHVNHFDWSESFRNNPIYETACIFQESIKTFAGSTTEDGDEVEVQLTDEQNDAYREVERHYRLNDGDTNILPLRMIVSGTAGTGKSTLLKALRKLLTISAVLLAPTGVAACNIGGQTIHSALRIPSITSEKEFKDLNGEALEYLQNSLSNVKYVIIDEMSMVSQRKLTMIDRRLRQAFTMQRNELFGGRSVLLFGDFGQLDPIGGLPLYSRRSSSAMQLSAMLAYQEFKCAKVLRQVIRQDTDEKFRDILQRMRIADIRMEDYEWLARRFKGRAAGSFDDAIHLFAKRAPAADHNLMKLMTLGQPVAEIVAEHVGGKVATNAKADEAGGLEPRLLLAKGAAVMLGANLNVKAGLCNGTTGTVEDIVYRNGGPPGLPLFVLCRFPAYCGPEFIPGEPKLVPIVPLTRRFTKSTKDCSRTNIPLCLAWAITIHKAQGLTLEKIFLNIGDKEFSSGLTFVGMSRVRTINDLMLAFFTYTRLLQLQGPGKCRKDRVNALRLEDQRLSNISAGICRSLREPQLVSSANVPSDVRPDAGLATMNMQQLSVQQRRDKCFELGLTPGCLASFGTPKDVSTNAVPTRIFYDPHPIHDGEPVGADGNCFYRVICQALTGQQSSHSILRQKLHAFMSNDPTILNDDLDALQRVITDGEWAQHVEMYAMSAMLQIPLCVFTPIGDSSGYKWRRICPPNIHADTPSIYIFHCDLSINTCEAPNHFTLVVDI